MQSEIERRIGDHVDAHAEELVGFLQTVVQSKSLWGDVAELAKLGKLAAIFSVWGQPDAAAELLTQFRDKLATVIDVDLGLELLAGQAQVGRTKADDYASYIAAFEADAPSFYPPPN